jgi:hypothetical protein
MLVGIPREGAAGIVEVILEMSGPKMFGFSADCRLTLTGEWDSCKASVPAGFRALEPFVDPRLSKVWLSFTGGFYFSADATVNGVDYGRGEVKMLIFDPMLEFESKHWRNRACPALLQGAEDKCDRLRLQIYHGVVGMSYNLLFGENFPTFSNVGMKLRPFGIVVPIGKWGRADLGADFSYDLRLYPRGFTAEDFGRVPVEAEGNGAEAVHALVFGLRIKLLSDTN